MGQCSSQLVLTSMNHHRLVLVAEPGLRVMLVIISRWTHNQRRITLNCAGGDTVIPYLRSPKTT